MFNGEGKKGADGTAVYPGMIAAPPTYPFGTVVELPGVGIGTVHDRGSRIIEWGDDVHRIDLWMGYGEEGLARSLAWGARHVTGMVYPIGADGTPAEKFSLDVLPSDPAVLAALPKSEAIDVLVQATLGEQSYAVRLLQNSLKDLGYFDTGVNGNFGPATQQALKSFLADHALSGDGSAVDSLTAAAITVAQTIKPENLPDVPLGIEIGASGNDVRQTQKLLRYLGFYRGRTNGVFDQPLKEAVTAFQISSSVVKQALDTGAGRIGPATQTAILKAWKAKQVGIMAKTALAKMQIRNKVTKEGLPSKVLASGDRGVSVEVLQKLLNKLGYLSDSDVTAKFGAKTKAAILAYQKEKNIVSSPKQRGAGVFGPATRQSLLKDAIDLEWRRVRSDGIASI
jgi:peptidoglycan hydrolase-like protein with peptidoglycan-binding domain/3D (Asp-Asp-Asp) domain-containing protein